MKRIIKNNKLFIILFLLSFLLMLICLFQQFSLFETSLNWMTNPDYRNHYCELTDVQPCMVKDLPSLWYENIKSAPISFEYLITFSTSFFQVLVPLIAMIPAFKLFQIWHSTSSLEMCRYPSKGKYIYKRSLSLANKCGIAMFLAFFNSTITPRL